jgi:hypothetical protein
MIDYGCSWNCSAVSSPKGKLELLCHSDAMTAIQKVDVFKNNLSKTLELWHYNP